MSVSVHAVQQRLNRTAQDRGRDADIVSACRQANITCARSDKCSIIIGPIWSVVLLAAEWALVHICSSNLF